MTQANQTQKTSSTKPIQHDYILIIDYGSQYTQLIARKIRELGCYCIVKSYRSPAVTDERLKGIILSGGPESVLQPDAPTISDWVFTLNQQQQIPLLGICYGMQALAKQLGGEVVDDVQHEYGAAQIRARNHSKLLKDIQDQVNSEGHGLLSVWMSHGNRVTQLPTGFQIIASNSTCPIAGMANEQQNIYALQFHPEVTHTPQGTAILKRFVLQIANCQPTWKISNICDNIIQQIRQKIKDQPVILGLSGGVDSSTCALLLQRAIGNQLTCIFIDHGLLRLHEADEVENLFGKHFSINLKMVNAKQQFMQALKGVTDPEQKRKIIGEQFIRTFEQQSKQIKNAKWLAQGTIYSDVIESSGNNSGHLIKSHHNVAGLPENMDLKIIEPIRELFKDEVRNLGLQLDLPEQLMKRHPFPGPGLAVRIIGEITEQKADILRQADALFIKELVKQGWYDKVSQAFCVLLSTKSVGVVGDARRYGWVVSLRAVETVDFMTARWAPLPYDLLTEISNQIVNEVSAISRVVYDITSKPPATIEWE